MSEWTITGPRHGGVTVSDLDRSLGFYVGKVGLELLWRRLYEEPEILEIVGVPDAAGLDIAMLRIPGGEVDIELIEYKGCERHPGSSRPCDYGTGHFCVYVTEIDALYDDLLAQGVAFRSAGPVQQKAGVNAGGKSLYSLDPDGYIFEFHQRPPR
ncbi:MAG: VOC family protein [Actinobacteria bacterium]|nr:VOC family protein [Actinomycetota bacterium]